MEFKTLPTKLNPNNYYPEVFLKSYLFLHHIAGHTADSAVKWWNTEPKNEHVSTPLIIERDGNVYRTFDEKYWAYALGLKGGTSVEKASIHIEIVAYGHLAQEEGRFFFKPTAKSKFLVPDEEVFAYEQGYRGHTFYHRYTKAQINSLCELIVYLKNKFNIPMERKVNGLFHEYVGGRGPYKPGLYSHSCVRKDKTDIHPQPDLIEALMRLHENNYTITT
jgi:N-acetyl-anhydromuramyl-L-alanine amidase AmpD